jgi:hypothetical protein
MSVLEIKGNIIQLLARLEDKRHLNQLKELASKFVVEENDNAYDEGYSLTAEQEAELMEAIEETYHEENLVSHEEALKVLSKWLPK